MTIGVAFFSWQVGEEITFLHQGSPQGCSKVRLYQNPCDTIFWQITKTNHFHTFGVTGVYISITRSFQKWPLKRTFQSKTKKMFNVEALKLTILSIIFCLMIEYYVYLQWCCPKNKSLIVAGKLHKLKSTSAASYPTKLKLSMNRTRSGWNKTQMFSKLDFVF